MNSDDVTEVVMSSRQMWAPAVSIARQIVADIGSLPDGAKVYVSRSLGGMFWLTPDGEFGGVGPDYPVYMDAGNAWVDYAECLSGMPGVVMGDDERWLLGWSLVAALLRVELLDDGTLWIGRTDFGDDV